MVGARVVVGSSRPVDPPMQPASSSVSSRLVYVRTVSPVGGPNSTGAQGLSRQFHSPASGIGRPQYPSPKVSQASGSCWMRGWLGTRWVAVAGIGKTKEEAGRHNPCSDG